MLDLLDVEDRVLTLSECRMLEAAGLLTTNGTAQVPLRYLFYPTASVIAHAERKYGPSLPEALILAGLREQSDDEGGAWGAWDRMALRRWVGYETADNYLTALHLSVRPLGNPEFLPRCAR